MSKSKTLKDQNCCYHQCPEPGTVYIGGGVLSAAVVQLKIAFAMRLLKLVNHRAGDDTLKHEFCDDFSVVHFDTRGEI